MPIPPESLPSGSVLLRKLPRRPLPVWGTGASPSAHTSLDVGSSLEWPGVFTQSVSSGLLWRLSIRSRAVSQTGSFISVNSDVTVTVEASPPPPILSLLSQEKLEMLSLWTASTSSVHEVGAPHFPNDLAETLASQFPREARRMFCSAFFDVLSAFRSFLSLRLTARALSLSSRSLAHSSLASSNSALSAPASASNRRPRPARRPTFRVAS
mmetsp:Transcript_54153/g.162165  ORF Transcript_54153/g.162165 Transcript_54153/m.162165 type:complete len:211 (+) Transcript_54153:323-955(+)